MLAKVRPGTLSGTLSVPGSKSHTIRAVLIATMAEGRSVIRNPLTSRDCLSSMRAARAFGAAAEEQKGLWIVEGLDGKLGIPEDIVDAGNSGTTLYFVAAMAALLEDWTVLTGDHQIRKRPIQPLFDALSELGAEGFTTRKGVLSPPAVLRGPIKAGTIHLEGNFSQYVSAVMLVSPLLEGTTRIEIARAIERPYLDMTAGWMKQQGISFEFDTENYRYFQITGPQRYREVNCTIPSDWESVAFPLVAAAITESEITIENLDLSGSQGDDQIVDVLKAMNADITLDKKGSSLKIRGGRPLRGITIDCSDIPDAVPILAVAGAFAEGTTTLANVEMVRIKETDRVALMHRELEKMGVEVEETHGTLSIKGGKVSGAALDSHDDHRIAMALQVAGLAADGETTVSHGECVAVSFPDFYEVMNGVGAGIITED